MAGVSTVALVLLLWLALAPVAVLEVVDLTSGARIARWPVDEAGELTLSYTHSMYGGDVRERFAATPDGRLTRNEFTTANAAAAEYYAYTARAERSGDRYTVAGPALTLRELLVRVDAIGRPVLTVGEDTLSLLDRAGDEDRVSIRIVNSPRVAWLFPR